MKKQDYFQSEVINKIPNNTVVGIDIGSRQAKAVLLHKDEFYTALISTGFFMQETAQELLSILLKESGIAQEDIEYIVVTGYGRVSLSFEKIPYRSVTEIACHGKGAYCLSEGVQTIIDIGGQDSKAIRINPNNGKVTDFVMNDKCAAGTGRFLEKVGQILELGLDDLGDTVLKSNKPAKISSQCVVFAESEVISLRATGEPREN